jgi:hypothetical protein
MQRHYQAVFAGVGPEQIGTLAWHCRSACHARTTPMFPYPDCGFRMVLSAGSPDEGEGEGGVRSET